MSDNASISLTALCGLLGVSVIVGALLYGCTTANERYWAAHRACVEAGGSWVPTRGDGDAACISKSSTTAQ